MQGNEYYVSGLGTKPPFGSFVLTEDDVCPSVTFLATDDLPEVVFGPGFGGEAGVETIGAAQNDVNAPVYNVLGQQVGADAKGLLIQNGKKFIRR